MAMSSVSAATNVIQQQQSATVRQAQPQAAERPREKEAPPPEAQRPPVVASQPEAAQRAEPPKQAERPEPPKPVVNAQGQKTGTIINTTA